MGSVIREVAQRADVRLREAGGLLLVSAADAPAFLEACLAARCQILGIEGFDIVDGGVRPDMEVIADFSELADAEQSVAEARAFLATIDDTELAFDFTIADNGGD